MGAITIERTEGGVAVIRLDVPDSKVNILSSRIMSDFARALDDLESDAGVRAGVLTSAKPDNFIAGADIGEIRGIDSEAAASEFVRVGHALLDRIAASPKPVVAAIHGAALGGGLEVVLACRYRIATIHPKTVLGLPEVMLGLLPGAGGTQRLPRLVGLVRALPMLLAGQRVRARKALQMGLVDATCEARDLERMAVEAAAGLADGVVRPRGTPLGVKVQNASPMRTLIVSKARDEMMRKTRGLYPAPPAILVCVETGLREGFAAGQAKEIELFGKLVVSPVAKNLIWLFDAMNELKKLPQGHEPRNVATLGILGGGLMGEGIASVSLPLADVVVRDVSTDALTKLKRGIEAGLAKRVSSGALTEEDAVRQRERLTVTTDPGKLGGADLVVEAVFEDLELKRRVLAETEAVVDDDCVIASNTSALPIGEIAAGARRADRVLGMHYFSPVPKMPLLEVIVRPDTSPVAEATARRFGIEQGKTVIVVRDGPGFYTTRILAPFLNEAILLLEEGAEIRALDSALKDIGFPVGPVTLLDEVGIDVAAHVAIDLGRAFAARGLAASPVLPKMVDAGYRGRKNGRGFFRYDGAKGKKPVNADVYEFFGGAKRKAIPQSEMSERLALLMVNEAVHCLDEGVLSSPRDGDVGAILGLGFPPFRGGPFHEVDRQGPDAVVARMQEIEAKLGARFAPSKTLVDMAARGTRFYG
jgi:3-hydroxyacyl-CoA dehydrogenase / enoyl-CoA hydratase / 3-hydroxybutyryl-CoA epimerase